MGFVVRGIAISREFKKKTTDSDSSNDDYSMDEEILYSDDNEVSDSSFNSSTEDDSSDTEPTDDDEPGDGVEVHGAEPYRFEPLRDPARDDAEAQATSWREKTTMIEIGS